MINYLLMTSQMSITLQGCCKQFLAKQFILSQLQYYEPPPPTHTHTISDLATALLYFKTLWNMKTKLLTSLAKVLMFHSSFRSIPTHRIKMEWVGSIFRQQTRTSAQLPEPNWWIFAHNQRVVTAVTYVRLLMTCVRQDHGNYCSH